MNPFLTLIIILNLLWSSYLTYLLVKKYKNSSPSSVDSQFSSDTKIYLTRFNPFEELGGDQSFILVLLDSHQNGVIITSLHAKETTRIYAKPIKNGQADGINLSKEEKIALAKTVKN